MKKFFVVISLLIGSLFYSASTAIATLADIKPGETKVISKSSIESITVYTTFVNLLTIEYVRIENNLERSTNLILYSEIRVSINLIISMYCMYVK